MRQIEKFLSELKFKLLSKICLVYKAQLLELLIVILQIIQYLPSFCIC